MKLFFQFIFSKLFFKQLLIAILISVVLFLCTIIALRIFTRHGKSVQVPDMRAYSEMQMEQVVKENNLRYEIIDSVHSPEVPPGTVFDQIPKAGAFVKENRKLFITMNALHEEQVKLPSLQNVSLRQAKVLLKQAGLKTGKITIVPSEYKDLVLKQLYADTLATPGMNIPKWSAIDLHVGQGLGKEKTAMPDFRGMYFIDAQRSISNSGLSEGSTIKDDTFPEEDENNSNGDSAQIWKQYPQPGVEVFFGKSVDLWLTMDTTIIYVTDTILRDSHEE